jgi:hypothetical protein
VKKIGLVRAAQQPVQDLAPDIYLANYFLRYAFCLVMVSIEVFRVRWTHRSDQSRNSHLVRSPVGPHRKPVASSFDRSFNEPVAVPLKGVKGNGLN